MSRYHSYIASATNILEAYQGKEPFVHFVRKQFAANKKFGSRDRKTIAGLCYVYFRVARAFGDDTIKDKILKAVLLCNPAFNEMLETLMPTWDEELLTASLHEKLRYLKITELDLFPFANELGEDMDKKAFAISLLQQPDLFIRIRPGRKASVLGALVGADIAFQQKADDCIALKNATSLAAVLELNRDAVVQDMNSQQVLDFLVGGSVITMDSGHAPAAWDCCAASGGKSILLHDRLHGKVKLTVSDIRPTILANLKKRLQEARVPIHKTFIADLSIDAPCELKEQFDIIVCDAPCTGSGTWARTPEQLAFFKKELISSYATRQEKIASNAIARLKPGGLFVYITCSVFARENEDVIAFLQETHGVTVMHSRYLKGYDVFADTMFVAALTK